MSREQRFEEHSFLPRECAGGLAPSECECCLHGVDVLAHVVDLIQTRRALWRDDGPDERPFLLEGLDTLIGEIHEMVERKR